MNRLPIPPQRRYRGGAYVLVLSIAMIVTVIGLSALSVARVRTKLLMGEQNASKVRLLAQSAAEVLTHRLSTSTNWRTTHTNNTWTAEEAWGDAMMSYKLQDDAGNSSLNADPLAPVRLYVKVRIDNTARLYSVQLKPVPPTLNNLLNNPGAESGSTSWSVPVGFAQLQLCINDNPHSGTQHFRIYNRFAAWAGPTQDITSRLTTSGTTHYAEVWVRMKNTPASVGITIHTENNFGTDWYFDGSNTSVGTNWTRVTATLSPTWTWTLDNAQIYVQTASGTQEFYIDDAVLILGNSLPAITLQPSSGTLRQETM